MSCYYLLHPQTSYRSCLLFRADVPADVVNEGEGETETEEEPPRPRGRGQNLARSKTGKAAGTRATTAKPTAARASPARPTPITPPTVVIDADSDLQAAFSLIRKKQTEMQNLEKQLASKEAEVKRRTEVVVFAEKAVNGQLVSGTDVLESARVKEAEKKVAELQFALNQATLELVATKSRLRMSREALVSARAVPFMLERLEGAAGKLERISHRFGVNPIIEGEMEELGAADMSGGKVQCNIGNTNLLSPQICSV